ncbi:heparinase II/III domain-containing protein [Paenibacillus koleovorans]|uniref:heparinase II/III domain-containing protein n=1 Tax=Paenibacillus koleovorans TaxID=121608 RepID=UPI0013E30679|nr:heparinase II/III family protein [Paenibacillus koleovorans]
MGSIETRGAMSFRTNGDVEWHSEWKPIENRQECIYGCELVWKAAAGVTMSPGGYLTRGVKGGVRQDVPYVDRLGTASKMSDGELQSVRLEVFVKSGCSDLQVRFRFSGTGPVEIEELRWVEGGFPDNPPYYGWPYTDWIESLKAVPAYEQSVGFPGPTAGQHQAEALELSEEAKAYLTLSEETIMDLVPERRPLPTYMYDKVPFQWSIAEPDMLRDGKGDPFDFERLYPVTGEETVETVHGGRIKYPYHELAEQGALPNKRLYLDQFMTEARFWRMTSAMLELSRYASQTGDEQVALRAAAILGAYGGVVPDWPVYGMTDYNSYDDRFYPPDTYELWFTFVWDRWYTPATGRLIGLFAEAYDLLRPFASAWDRIAEIGGRHARQDAADMLLHICRMSLKYDAYNRNDIWKFYHNTIGSQLRGLIQAGKAIGCPELVHYAAHKAYGAFNYLLMSDGMFPESVSYLHDLVGGIGRALSYAAGYSDPPQYVSTLERSRFDRFDIRSFIPSIAVAESIIDRLRFPDGSLTTIHDTWAETVYENNRKQPPEKPQLKSGTIESYLLPDFGHAILGQGRYPDGSEAHLHYSGCYGHEHYDMLNIGVWAYGDELASDLGYTHLGGYIKSTASHNLVMLDGQSQHKTACGDLLRWYPGSSGSLQTVQAQSSEAYPQAETYRRLLIAVPVTAAGQPVYLDVFEVVGGTRHDWMANGCADYDQRVDTSLDICEERDNLAADGVPYVPIVGEKRSSYMDPPLPTDAPGEESVYWAAFREARIARPAAEEPWQLTFAPLHQEGEIGPGLSPRAAERRLGPSLRLHWLAPAEGEEVMLCRAPRNRYYKEMSFLKEAMGSWTQLTMPKVIVRRQKPQPETGGIELAEPQPLSSRFVALWEPFPGDEPLVSQAALLPGDPGFGGVGVRVEGRDGTRSTVLYNAAAGETSGAGDLSSDSAIASAVEMAEGLRLLLEMVDGSYIQSGSIRLERSRTPALELIGTERQGEDYALIVRGEEADWAQLTQCDPNPLGRHLAVRQPGRSARWIPFREVSYTGNGEGRIWLDRNPGFQYTAGGRLTETCYPYRSWRAEASIHFQSELRAELNYSEDGQLNRISVVAETPVHVTLTGNFVGDPVLVSACKRIPIAAARQPDGNGLLRFVLPPATGSDPGWTLQANE